MAIAMLAVLASSACEQDAETIIDDTLASDFDPLESELYAEQRAQLDAELDGAQSKIFLRETNLDDVTIDDLSYHFGVPPDDQIVVLGEIGPSAFEEFKAVYEQAQERYQVPIVSLNSMGGSANQAAMIAEFVSQNHLTTIIESGSVCYSACAFIFMAGRMDGGGEGPGGVNRLLHINGRLGFHAPFLAYSPSKKRSPYKGTYGGVANAYNSGLRQIGQMLAGPYPSSTRWPSSLVGEMLLTPPDRLREVTTVDDAGRWEIELIGTPQEVSELTPRQMYIGCRNLHHWAYEELWNAYHYDIYRESPEAEEETVMGWSRAQSRLPDAPPLRNRIRVPIDELNGLACIFSDYPEDDDNRGHITVQFGGREDLDLSLPAWMAFDPEYPIARLPKDGR
ncbi:hypothetical protein NAP1_03705 [Erythrobacter sp. NAP1]|nr:hypothetical protein NAP1_03705 [Erythrobacter sp. NAP1]